MKTCRQFSICTQPTIADPAWVQPVFEIHKWGSREGTLPEGVGYSDATEILGVIWKLQYDLGYKSGRNSETIRTRKFLESKGWTAEQIKEYLFF